MSSFPFQNPKANTSQDSLNPRRKILMVDDEESLTRMYKINLEATKKFEVCTENNALQAFRVAKAFKPEMIFLDVIMPNGDVSEIVRQIREEPSLAKVPIVFLTATVTLEEVKQRGGLIGGEAFLAKPVTVKEIVDCIKDHIGE